MKSTAKSALAPVGNVKKLRTPPARVSRRVSVVQIALLLFALLWTAIGVADLAGIL
jgi:hypothetical protein